MHTSLDKSSIYPFRSPLILCALTLGWVTLFFGVIYETASNVTVYVLGIMSTAQSATSILRNHRETDSICVLEWGAGE